MNPNSPGNQHLEEGIELIGIHQESVLAHGEHTTALHHDYEEEQLLDGNDTQALLNGNAHGPRGLEAKRKTFAVIWRQIKGIVIEVHATLGGAEKYPMLTMI